MKIGPDLWKWWILDLTYENWTWHMEPEHLLSEPLLELLPPSLPGIISHRIFTIDYFTEEWKHWFWIAGPIMWEKDENRAVPITFVESIVVVGHQQQMREWSGIDDVEELYWGRGGSRSVDKNHWFLCITTKTMWNNNHNNYVNVTLPDKAYHWDRHHQDIFLA